MDDFLRFSVLCCPVSIFEGEKLRVHDAESQVKEINGYHSCFVFETCPVQISMVILRAICSGFIQPLQENASRMVPYIQATASSFNALCHSTLIIDLSFDSTSYRLRFRKRR
jgi:hypothetical protein